MRAQHFRVGSLRMTAFFLPDTFTATNDKSRSFGSRLSYLLGPNAGATLSGRFAQDDRVFSFPIYSRPPTTKASPSTRVLVTCWAQMRAQHFRVGSLRMTAFFPSRFISASNDTKQVLRLASFNCLLRPNAGATYSVASLRMTGFLLSRHIAVRPADFPYLLPGCAGDGGGGGGAAGGAAGAFRYSSKCWRTLL